MAGTLPSSCSLQSAESGDEFDLVQMLLEEQHVMTAVERFSALHDASTGDAPAQERYYRDLLPASPPAEGQQFAFEVDLDLCSGCKACVVACHTLNGLEEDESWRRVGTVTIGEAETSRIQHVTTACHHCQDPGCLNGCPVKAYDKDPVTGIVRHLDDQCIGCKYCTMMCPYEVPQYSDRLGIVRKCDMCHQRLSAGEAPACVQSCPNEAISIRIVEEKSDFSADDRLAPGAPASTITLPTTNYQSTHGDGFSRGTPQDADVDEVAESHWPLALMLVLTQASVGMLVIERLAATVLWLAGSSMPLLATQISTYLSLLLAIIGLNLATLHLGQPMRAWRVFLGLRTSWLSREAVIFGQYTALLALACGLLWLPDIQPLLPEGVGLSWIPGWAAKAALGASLAVGLVGLYSSAMIYIATQRELWNFRRTMTRFMGSGVVTGLAFSLSAFVLGGAPRWLFAIVTLVAIAALASKVLWEWAIQLGPVRDQDSDLDRRCRQLVHKQLDRLRQYRLAACIAAGSLLAFALVASPGPSAILISLAVVAALSTLAGEIFERLLYFTSVVYSRMPGTLR